MITFTHIVNRHKKYLLIYIFLCSAFFTQVLAQNNNGKSSITRDRIISVDFNNVKGKFNTMFKECIGAGRSNEGLRADWQQQLALVKKECDFKYIRMHGLLTDDMGVYKEDPKGNPEYNFHYIDLLYDYLLSQGIKPFVELGFMPTALASGNQTVFWWKGNVTPPKDYAKWEELIRRLTLHFTERYGADEVKTWYFEVWNEPNLTPSFWTGTQEEYFKLYKHTANAIRSVNKEYKIGGPASAGAAWVTDMINFCSENKVPLDYISTHSYGVRQGYLDEYGNAGTILDKNQWSVSEDILNSHKEISNSSMPNLELHYTEWSSSYTPADPIHDSYHQAAYILEKIKQVGSSTNSMSYWVFTDIFEEAGPRFTSFHGGFGLLNYQGIKKPSFYAYSFLNKMGETELTNTDSTSWACKNSKGDIQILLWDFTYTLPDSMNNQKYYIRDLPANLKEKVRLEISGISKGKYKLEIYKVGYKTNDPYTTYLSMGKPSQLTKAEVDFIKQQNDGSPFYTEIMNLKQDSLFLKELDIRENEVLLFKLTKL